MAQLASVRAPGRPTPPPRGAEVLASILASRPLVDMLGADDEEQALFARTQQDDTGAVAGKAQPIGDAAIDAVIKRV